MSLFRRNRTPKPPRTLTIILELAGDGPGPTKLWRGDTFQVNSSTSGDHLFSMKFNGDTLVFRQQSMFVTGLKPREMRQYAQHLEDS